MIYILDKRNGKLVKSEIRRMDKGLIPLKKNGWNFNWKNLSRIENTQSYILRTNDTPSQVEGALCLKREYGMLIMEALELAPHNIGQSKRYDYVAGCLIAFGCKESFGLDGDYRGFLTFTSKSNLVEWYRKKYGAELALGQRMFIDWQNGERLIEKYLDRRK